MIRFENVSKTYRTRGLTNEVFSNVNFTLSRRESLGICGANGAGKSTLMRVLAGIEQPTGGRVVRNMRTSWPIGLASCFEMSMTGADNARFIARIYQKDEEEVIAYVDEFARLGVFMNQPVTTYSSGMASRLAFGVSLAVEFDCYIIDEVTAVGDTRFRRRCEQELLQRRDTGAMIMTSHNPGELEKYCNRGAVLFGGTLTLYDTIGEAVEVHHALQMATTSTFSHVV